MNERLNGKIKRFYYNYTATNQDTLYENYDKVPFYYELSLDLPQNTDIIKDSLYNIVMELRNEILHKNINLKKIIIVFCYTNLKDQIILKLLESKFLKNTGNMFPVFAYTSLILSWFSVTNNKNQSQFFQIFEKKLGLELIILLIGFFLIGFGQNNKKINEKIIYLGIFIIFSTGALIRAINNIEILVSLLSILINHFVCFVLQTGDYGVEANNDFFKGKGIIFKFVITVLYGIPMSLLIVKFNLHTSQFVVGYSIIVYYSILLSIELKNLYSVFFVKKRHNTN